MFGRHVIMIILFILIVHISNNIAINFPFLILFYSIVKMFATHRDDRKRVEKALESINIQTGKVDIVFCTLLEHIRIVTLRVASIIIPPLLN